MARSLIVRAARRAALAAGVVVALSAAVLTPAAAAQADSVVAAARADSVAAPARADSAAALPDSGATAAAADSAALAPASRRVIPRDVEPPRAAARPSRADSAAAAARPKTAPFKVMMRSALVPGWGQMYNHQPLKAALVVGVEGFLVAKALHELHLQNRSLQAAADAEALGDVAAQDAATLEADLHRNRKISWVWWAVAAHLLSMADAYVDAHLSTFDRDFEFRESGRLRAAAPELRLGYRVRF